MLTYAGVCWRMLTYAALTALRTHFNVEAEMETDNALAFAFEGTNTAVQFKFAEKVQKYKY